MATRVTLTGRKEVFFPPQNALNITAVTDGLSAYAHISDQDSTEYDAVSLLEPNNQHNYSYIYIDIVVWEYLHICVDLQDQYTIDKNINGTI